MLRVERTTGYVAEITIERSVTTVAPKRVHSVQDIEGYLPGLRPYDGGVTIKRSLIIQVLSTSLVATNHANCGRATGRDNFFQRQEIDRLVGENMDLRAHIGALEFEIT
ncbi:hypothetical protein Tco_1029732 [Tanacetum coccineum]|uniref:Uncharacterized protein n=1 Tax=Tanacetum coccineum TaxID=301880 RepID=A0ABQ5G4H8_9ASTR